jgi:hypothetical protein
MRAGQSHIPGSAIDGGGELWSFHRLRQPQRAAGDAAKGATAFVFHGQRALFNLFASFGVPVTGLPACSRGCT